MQEKIAKITEKVAEQINDVTVGFLENSVNHYFHGLEETMKTFGMRNFFLNRMFDGGVVPAINSLLEMEKDFTDSLLQSVYGEKNWFESAKEMRDRLVAGTRYNELVLKLGKEIFGKATFEGEKQLHEDDHFRLTFIPAKKGTTATKMAVFHVGGILPYSDLLFRFLPEVNFFERFTEAGIPVYAMELKGDKDEIGANFGKLNLDRYVDAIKEMTDIAFKHNQNEKLVLESYCATTLTAIAYVNALPKDADKKIKVFSTYVGPVDGSKCSVLSDMMTLLPQNLLLTHYTMANLTGGYVTGDSLRRTQDMALKGFFPKTAFGRFVTGWKNKEYADVNTVADLSDEQRKDLAGAYWISPENCNRFPVPLDIARFSTRVFIEGVGSQGEIPYKYKGTPLSFQALLKETSIQMVGFYGEKDRLVPGETADILVKVLGNRYTKVVHKGAGHISYVLTPKVWDKKNPKALDPNPIDLITKLYNK